MIINTAHTIMFHLKIFNPSKTQNGSKLKNATQKLNLANSKKNKPTRLKGTNDAPIRPTNPTIMLVRGPARAVFPSTSLLRNPQDIDVYPEKKTKIPTKLPIIFSINVVQNPEKLKVNLEKQPYLLAACLWPISCGIIANNATIYGMIILPIGSESMDVGRI